MAGALIRPRLGPAQPRRGRSVGWNGVCGAQTAIVTSLAVSPLGLFAIGTDITLFTARPVAFSGLRQVVFGLLAAAVTYAIGRLVGVALVG